jgi:hypothetical protein
MGADRISYGVMEGYDLIGLPEVLEAVSTSRLSCKRAGKTRTLMPVWDSSGESRVITMH